MKAVVPLNVAALRVSSTDSTNVTPRAGFAGRTAAFDLLPHGSLATQASTGDTIWIPLGSGSPSVPWRPASTCTGSCPSSSSAATRTRTWARSCSRTRPPAGWSSAR